MLTDIPCVLMRGGTSKGPYFLAEDMPSDPAVRDRVLLAVMGSPHVRQIDGIGGGDSLTSKAVILGRSNRPGIDIDYLFAQIAVGKGGVDTAPNCGNMLSGVGPYAIERGLVPAGDPITTVRIFNINTSKVVEAVIQTPGGRVTYDGDAKVDGVPGSGAPIVLNFLNAAGAKTGKLLPTGNPIDIIDGIEVSCVDLSSPLVFVAAASLGKTGYESKKELDSDPELLRRLEEIRQRAAVRMGMGDVSGKVLPKFALVAPPMGERQRRRALFRAMELPLCICGHGSALSGAAASIPGTVAYRAARHDRDNPGVVAIEHPAGRLETRMSIQSAAGSGVPVFDRAGIVRTARPLLEGVVHIPDDVWRNVRKVA